MGLLNRKDIFSSKWPTAEIVDGAGRLYYVPIKHTLGNYFIALIEGELYPFEIINRRQCTYRSTMSKTFHLYRYDISHNKPLGPELQEMAQWMREHGISQIDNQLYELLSSFADTEGSTKKFLPHDLGQVQAELEAQDGDTAQALAAYLRQLPLKKIVQPVRPLRDYLKDDVKTYDPKYLGMVTAAVDRTMQYQHEMANVPITAKKPMLKLLLIAMLGLAIVGVLAIAYEEGYLDGIIGGQSPLALTATPGEYTPEALTAAYADPRDLAMAVLDGTLDYDLLPPTFRAMVDAVDPADLLAAAPPPPPPPPAEDGPEPDLLLGGADILPSLDDFLPAAPPPPAEEPPMTPDEPEPPMTPDEPEPPMTPDEPAPPDEPDPKIAELYDTIEAAPAVDNLPFLRADACPAYWDYTDCIRFVLAQATHLSLNEKHRLYQQMIGVWAEPELQPECDTTSYTTMSDYIQCSRDYIAWHEAQQSTQPEIPDHYDGRPWEEYYIYSETNPIYDGTVPP